tara:strand:- start:91 stop:777 length:687 start_codon:yes stop_codon:yes gene_type:complete
MNALILSAGYGKRLKPITLTKPKCLIGVKGKPIISIWIEKLIKINTKKIFINTHFKHKLVENYLKKKRFNAKLEILYEPTLLGTAGTLIKNMKYFINSNLILAHCDNYFLESLSKIISFHHNRPKKYLMTMVAFKTRKPESCGIIKEKNNSIIDYFEKKKGHNGNLANGATYIISPEMLKIIDDNFSEAKDFSNDIIPFIKDYIYVYKTEKIFKDIGTIENLNQVNSL